MRTVLSKSTCRERERRGGEREGDLEGQSTRADRPQSERPAAERFQNRDPDTMRNPRRGKDTKTQPGEGLRLRHLGECVASEREVTAEQRGRRPVRRRLRDF